jgi:cell division protein FtsW
MIGVSFMSPRQIRRSALIMFALSVILIVATLWLGPEVKGAKRWITLVGVNIQASESAKPAFVVLAAWLFAESARKPEMPATSMALALLLGLVTLLVMEPDFGQTMLILMVWGALFFIAGMRIVWVFGLAGTAAAGLFTAYLLVPHVAVRIQRFMDPASGDTFQVDTAMEAFSNGGWFGLGPGEGIAKRSLPDSHTDFVFAVGAEEFGIIMCLALLALFSFIVIRTLSRAYATEDMFSRFAASGLAIMFGVQAAINMAVNLHLIPAKGMTLPFISYGGSSMISLAYGVGMMLALTRQRPRTEMESIGDANTAASYA